MEEIIFKKIGEYQYSSEAFIYKAKLESEEIEVFVRDNHTIDSDPFLSNAIGGVKLFVREYDYEKAMVILSEISKFSVDDKGELIKCPKCGAEKIQLLTTIKDFKSFISFLFSFLIIALPFYNRYKYKCEKCNFEF
ncbi:putative RNA-binding Zn-ribbon protein involved in translation (DUF1610 family) [Flavobacterium arsenatis]|uniref:RNA-binding Zn-ribbon protein involved in translation (DUF1610 family) n=1 Tax=Flavobacterium arsenatis TaxID=1484332 RepID=A0ABU1TL99_9FLAO|nr:DUF2007 domain-containing protein [Flavobacterium arsenatis]MDR6966751.1 putative RNA-binding Zn-ribbon protein involved in translation (DUF1610 family) [Flavobacterium arsenatis]